LGSCWLGDLQSVSVVSLLGPAHICSPRHDCMIKGVSLASAAIAAAGMTPFIRLLGNPSRAHDAAAQLVPLASNAALRAVLIAAAAGAREALRAAASLEGQMFGRALQRRFDCSSSCVGAARVTKMYCVKTFHCLEGFGFATVTQRRARAMTIRTCMKVWSQHNETPRAE
jgi:hypothetical protein